MNRNRVESATVLTAVALLVLALAPPPGASAQGSKVPVVSLKNFTSVAEWQLDITWHAKDEFENKDCRATVDMTATARLILKQSVKRDSWGRWHVEKVQSANLTLRGIYFNKLSKEQTEWKPAPERAADGGATFEVGVLTPGYQLTCVIAYPATSTTRLRTFDSLVSLMTADISGGLPVFLTGPLPGSGTTIHGSRVFSAIVAPFAGSGDLPMTRVGVQFVLQELAPLTPLVPTKKK